MALNSPSPIKGKIAGIEDEYTVLINKGERDGVELGMIFAIEADESGEVVTDPETGEVLGRRPKEVLQVKVSDVFEKYCVAQTFRSYSLLNSTYSMPSQHTAQDSVLGFRFRYRDRINTAAQKTKGRPPGPVEVTVKIGDTVKQVASL